VIENKLILGNSLFMVYTKLNMIDTF